MEIRTNACSLLAVAVSVILQAEEPRHAKIKSFSVGQDATLNYPNHPNDPNQLIHLPDEHTTIIPPGHGSDKYLVFAAAQINGGKFGAVVLETKDLIKFEFATALGYDLQVLTSPLAIGACDPTYNTEFDENYAAPGSVVQDPTLPPGNLIALYEAENYCPGGSWEGTPFYATVGFARSSDNGRTWPAPETGALGGPDRHPVLKSSTPEPTGPHGYIGDAIPSAFVDDKRGDEDAWLYIAYGHYAAETGNPPSLGVARAKLGENALDFKKWYKDGFTQPGIGGLDSDPVPAGGCATTPRYHPEISYNDDLGLYLMVFWCDNGSAGADNVTWYYSTTKHLDRQDWTAPRVILNSERPVTTPCTDRSSGQQFDGWYPSLMSPGAAAGHTKLSGFVFFLAGCTADTDRHFLSRPFTITTEDDRGAGD
jgi:hypothetical protein